jgi:PilZ domain
MHRRAQDLGEGCLTHPAYLGVCLAAAASGGLFVSTLWLLRRLGLRAAPGLPQGQKRPSGKTAARPCSPDRGSSVFSVAAFVRPEEFLSGWRPDAVRLLLPATRVPRLGGKAAVRVHLSGQPVCATVTGKIVCIFRHESQLRVELAPDAASLPAVRLLAAAARGERVGLRERPRRYLVELPVMVVSGEAKVYTTTFSISEGGCGLRWSGPPLRVGAELQVRLGAGPRAPEARVVVCWTASLRSQWTVGLRFVTTPGGSYAWGTLFDGVASSGAPAA